MSKMTASILMLSYLTVDSSGYCCSLPTCKRYLRYCSLDLSVWLVFSSVAKI